MIRDIVSCQGTSISSAIVSQIFHHILKREGVFYVVVLINKLQSFVAEEVTIGLLGIQSMCQGKLVDDSNYVNGRRQTNIGIFRAYLNAYLANCPYINKDMTFMVRQLPPTETGVPIQIYAFSSNKAWISYENIQSDIFDHVFAVVTMFDLKIYQKPSSNSLAMLPEALE